MNKWKSSSFIELIIENTEMLRMFYKMLNSQDEVTSIISPMIVPYIALLAEGNNSMFGGAEEYPKINGKN